MCGIFGWNFKKKSGLALGKRESLASTLAVANSYRGDQSWGAYMLDAKGKYKIAKAVGDLARVQGTSTWGSRSVVMAHTRYATVGAVTPRNAHPFRVGKVILAHNGAIFNHYALNFKLDRKCEVDSEHLAHHIDEGRSFDDLEGYGAIEWVEDDRPDAVYLSRLRMGSLSVYGIKKGPDTVGVVWSSDEDHLKAALGAARLECFPFKKPEEGVTYKAVDGDLFVIRERAKLELRSGYRVQESRSITATSGGYVGSGYTGSPTYGTCKVCDHYHSVRDGTCWKHGCDCVEGLHKPEEKKVTSIVVAGTAADTGSVNTATTPDDAPLVHMGGDQWMDADGHVMTVNDVPEPTNDEITEYEVMQDRWAGLTGVVED